jgi:virginiamycin B lyase
MLLLLTALMACFATLRTARAESLYTITEYQVPTSNANVNGIALGPDGAMWFTEYNANKIGRVTNSGVFTEYDIPTADSEPDSITAGPDGNIWFVEYNANKIAKMSTSGVVLAEYDVPTSGANVYGITAGPDGALWFTEFDANKIGRVTTSGVFSEYTIPTSGVEPYGITKGPDGALWFGEYDNQKIGRITTSGDITEYPLPSGSYAIYLVTGPDGNIWYTDYYYAVAKVNPYTHEVTKYDVPNVDSDTFGQIAVGADGNLWFPDYYGNKIWSVTTAGVLTSYDIPTAGSYPWYMAAGSDGYIWFTEDETNTVAKMRVAEAIPTTAEIVPTLSLTPDHVAGISADTRLNLSIKLKNLGPGGAGFVLFEVPLEPTILLDYANFGNSGMWVTKVTPTSVRVELRQLDNGSSVSGSLVLKPNPDNLPIAGTELSFKIQVTYADEVRGEQAISNKVSVTFGESNLDVNQDTVQTLAPATAKAGDKVAVNAELFIPNEKVVLWYTGPDEKSVDLGYVWADENGKISASFDTTGLANGSYSFVAHGLKSEVRACTIVTVS